MVFMEEKGGKQPYPPGMAAVLHDAFMLVGSHSGMTFGQHLVKDECCTQYNKFFYSPSLHISSDQEIPCNTIHDEYIFCPCCE